MDDILKRFVKGEILAAVARDENIGMYSISRHICANWKKNHPGTVLKNLFWMAPKSFKEFNMHMDEIEGISPFYFG